MGNSFCYGQYLGNENIDRFKSNRVKLTLFFLSSIPRNPIFIMAKNNGSNKHSNESNDLLNGMKRYLKIEHQDDDIELLEYIKKQASMHRE